MNPKTGKSDSEHTTHGAPKCSCSARADLPGQWSARSHSHRVRVGWRVDVAVGRLPHSEGGAGAAGLAHRVNLHVHARLLSAGYVERCRQRRGSTLVSDDSPSGTVTAGATKPNGMRLVPAGHAAKHRLNVIRYFSNI